MHKFLARLKIPFKILVAPFVTTLMMMSLWWLATSGLRQQEDTLNFLVNNTMPSVRAANNLTQSTAAVQSSLFRLVVWQEINRQQDVINKLNQDIQEQIGTLKPGYRRLVERSGLVADPLLSKVGSQIENYARNATVTRKTAYRNPSFANTMLINTTALYDKLIDGLNEFQGEMAGRARARADEAAAGATQLIRILGLVVLIDMAVAVSVTLLVSHHISSGIRRTTYRMRALVDGDVSEPPEEGRRNDEIGEMLKALEVFRRSEIERRELESQRIESEKLASLGALVAGVAHEINTPIGICRTAASHLSEETQKVNRLFQEGQITKKTMKEYLQRSSESTEIIENNIQAASQLIQSFKQVSADQASGEFREVKLSEYIDEVVLSVWPKLRRANIRVVNHCDSEVVLETYPGSLSQVITNFLVNALNHAFDDNGGTIAVSGRPLPDGAQADRAEAVYISVCDNGKGVDDETKRQIFEPFFTTKRGAGGTGLGLHLAHNIVTQTLAGRLECRSEPERGTCFDLILPVDQRQGPPRMFRDLAVSAYPEAAAATSEASPAAGTSGDAAASDAPKTR